MQRAAGANPLHAPLGTSQQRSLNKCLTERIPNAPASQPCVAAIVAEGVSRMSGRTNDPLAKMTAERDEAIRRFEASEKLEKEAIKQRGKEYRTGTAEPSATRTS